MVRLFFAVLVLMCFSPAQAATIAIIIDDVGNSHNDTQVLNLPDEVTISVLPHTPYGRQIAQRASLADREVMLHVPMETLSGYRLGPGAIVSDMSDAAIEQQLLDSLVALPYAVGVNNHMGSKLTQMRKPMQVFMQALKERDLYFVDSRTTKYTLAEQVADETGVTNWRRHVFLDSIQSKAFVRKQLRLLIKTAEKQGFAIAIGHPYPETLAVLLEELPLLEKHIMISRISHLPQTDMNTRYAYSAE
ncbi:divergent polysaccharide deacetylase family protein [Algibacillus agarilyticus]|uniref:divergent polysaccharide deacetylase family protein n=1 Tax=Algibacillus agarilyticus TaxID=2234133 RepID=UPI000DCFF923|nr:divergent polysaccharide deacetylase family protein [Algibacillus agarilyticus]